MIKQQIDKFFYVKYDNNWDDKLLRNTVLSYTDKNFVILDLGAGAGIIKDMNFKGLVSKVYGIDPDKRVENNIFLDYGIQGYGDDMYMFPPNKFDLIFSDNVLEHIPDPNKLFSEISRVLKPGALFISKTPNKNYYVSLIGRVTPHKFHRFINKIRGRDEEDTFPTLYKLNSKKNQMKIASKHKLEVISFEYYEGRPEYLRHFGILYFLGLLYERIVNKLGLNKMKAIMISVFQKPN